MTRGPGKIDSDSGARGPSAGSARNRTILMVAGGAAIAVVVIFIASRLDDPTARSAGGRRIQNPRELVNPAPLTDEEKRTGRTLAAQPLVELERGAWVQVTDEQGNLAQQYGAEHVEPLPDRWMRLESPRAIFYRADGRVVTLKAKKGEARVPGRALESGRLDGEVRIEMFRPRAGAAVDLTRDRPTLTVDAEDATFDNVLGEVRCDGAIALKSDAGSFNGTGMRLLLDPGKGAGASGGRGGSIERLVIEHCTRPIVLVRGADGRARPVDAIPASGPPAGAPSGAAPPSAQAAPAAPVAPVEERFYRLRLDDNVRVRREKNGRSSRLAGDALEAVFSLDGSQGIGSVAAPPTFAPSPSAAIVAAAFASQNASASNEIRPTDEVITIEYDGRLVLEPSDEKLTSRDDVHVRMLASDGHVVTLDDEETKAHVECARVGFKGGDDLIEAFGSAGKPLTVTSPRLQAKGERFFLRRGLGKGGFVGPGSIELASGGEAFAAFAFDPDTAIVSRDDDGTVLVSAMAAAAAPTPPRSVTIGWSEKLDLDFAPTAPDSQSDGDLRQATFVGAVAVAGENFALDAETLLARFSHGAAAKDAAQLSRIIASGAAAHEPAIARRLDGTGSLAASTLDLTLVADLNGNAAPARLEATGDVSASDPKQSIYGDRLVTVFVDPATRAKTEAANEPQPKKAGKQDVPVDIASVDLGGDVQAEIRSPDAPTTRVFAERLEGDGLARTLRVSGTNNWIVRDVIVADRLGQIRFDDATRVATAAGPGRVRAFPEAIEIPAGRAPRPTLPDHWRLDAEWTDGFVFDEKAADGRGAIDLKGAVHVRNTPSRRSTDALDAATLRLELSGRDDRVPASPEPSGAQPTASAPAATAATALGGERASVRRIVARGGAVIASRAWTSDARLGDPRLFSIKGDHVSYDTISREGFVDGPGALLVHVPEQTRDAPVPSPKSAESAPNGASSAPMTAGGPLSLGAEGTSRFLWTKRLDMVGQGQDRFLITLDEGVELTHAGIRADDKLSLTSARLEARVVRERPATAAVAPAALGADAKTGQQPMGETPGVDLGGTARIESIRADGQGDVRVRIQTPELDIECDQLAYSVADQTAFLSGTEGRSAKVVRRSDGQPLTAEQLSWNMATGVIRIEGARGRVGR